MCIITTDICKDNWDATNSWSGYNYQGKIALYLGLRKINDLITTDNQSEISKFSLEMEWLEDFSIVYTNGVQRIYKSIHQVKAKENTSIGDYEDALVKLYQKVKKDNLIENAYLHVCRLLDYKGSTWNETVDQIIRNGNQTKILKKKIVDYKNSSIDNKKDQVEKLNGRGRNSEVNSRIKQYNETYFHYKKVTATNVDDILENIILDLDEIIQLGSQSIEVQDIEKITLYAYPENSEYCEIDEIDDLILEEIIRYWENSNAPTWKGKDTSFNNIILLCLQGLVDKHITERHVHYNETEMRDIQFQQIVEILDSNSPIERCEEYYLYVIKERLMRRSREYHNECLCEWDSDDERNEKCENCEISVFYDQLASASESDLKEFIHATNPDITAKIDGDNWEQYCNETKFQTQFFKGLRDIIKPYDKEKKYVTYVDRDKKLNLLTTIVDDETRKAIMKVCSKIVKNPNLNEVLMDYDYLISKGLNSDSVFYGAGDFLEDFKIEENHVYHYKNLKIKSLNKTIEELGGN